MTFLAGTEHTECMNNGHAARASIITQCQNLSIGINSDQNCKILFVQKWFLMTTMVPGTLGSLQHNCGHQGNNRLVPVVLYNLWERAAQLLKLVNSKLVKHTSMTIYPTWLVPLQMLRALTMLGLVKDLSRTPWKRWQWQCNDNAMTMQWQCNDNAMTMQWQCNDNAMTLGC